MTDEERIAQRALNAAMAESRGDCAIVVVVRKMSAGGTINVASNITSSTRAVHDVLTEARNALPVVII